MIGFWNNYPYGDPGPIEDPAEATRLRGADVTMDTAPRRCVICKREIIADDLDFEGPRHTATCIACVRRLAGTETRVDPKLAAQVSEAMLKDL